MKAGDTIMALSSGSLPAGVAVIRLSGPDVRNALMGMAGVVPEPRKLVLRPIGAETRIDQGLVAYFPAPHSFTGEDCAEFQVHGSPAGIKAILGQLRGLGLRMAGAGEFTRRAFENGKLDLVEAQGLGDLILAETENQRALAYARMEGGLSRRIDGWRERLLDLRAEIEAQLDFSDEGDVGSLPGSFAADVLALKEDIDVSLSTQKHGRILRTGFRVVLAGPPNAGKSSLLNALSKSDVAIVSEEAGTTRDLKEVPMDIDGQLIILVDSAGIRETTSKAEGIGVERAMTAMRGADLVLWLTPADGFSDSINQPTGPAPALRLGTKVDISDVPGADISVSAKTGYGLPELLRYLHDASGANTFPASSPFLSHEQDYEALLSASLYLAKASSALDYPELASENLRTASSALERLLGKMDAERVLDHLFSKFCIGK